MRFSFFALTVSALTAILMAATLLPAGFARAQVKVEDQTQSFSSQRESHLRAIEAKPERWWRGNMSDRGIVSATNPRGGAAGTGTALNNTGNFGSTGNINNPMGNPLTANTATPAPGTENARSPAEVQPFFSFEQMLNAAQGQPGVLADEAPEDMSEAPQPGTLLETAEDLAAADPQPDEELSDTALQLLERANVSPRGPGAPVEDIPVEDIPVEDEATAETIGADEMLDVRNPNPF